MYLGPALFEITECFVDHPIGDSIKTQSAFFRPDELQGPVTKSLTHQRQGLVNARDQLQKACDVDTYEDG